jgi:hypothetical protein
VFIHGATLLEPPLGCRALPGGDPLETPLGCRAFPGGDPLETRKAADRTRQNPEAYIA